MAFASFTKKMKEIATCPICMNLMTRPVTISCGHSYCSTCLPWSYNTQNLLGWQKSFHCPLCQVSLPVTNYGSNKVLENLLEVIGEMDLEQLCGEHGEQLHLFCENEGQLICWRCERAPAHAGHNTTPVEDACQVYKEQLQIVISKLNHLHEACTNQKAFVARQITEWKEKITARKQKIKSDFTSLQVFLGLEEQCHLWRLEEEEEDLLSRLRDSEARLRHESDELQSRILELEAKCQSSSQKLLQDVKDIVGRNWGKRLETLEDFPMEIHTTCNVSELYLDVKKMLRRYQVSVTLDPDTAHPSLTLSEDGRQVTLGGCQKDLDFSPRRFSAYPCVLGFGGFSSGRHYFEVDVGEGTAWDLGVCLDGVQRGADMKQEPECGFWTIRLHKGEDYLALTSPPTPLPLCEKPLVVGVFLDWETGFVSFYNMTTGSHIFTFQNASFFTTLQPFFRVYQHSPLFLPPLEQEERSSLLGQPS
ncbi:tripartite motif containing 38 [Ictidomys tridecemlineatus]|uniref:Tripartite motif containing 38 n=1 Tax=Ictidomys tridecemlineatus TaxID=43179 RepID=I3MQF3_ICTTR|nr:E3 ubiquitin-protein ligase TRIM38 [Ictidomys tridecemlineatus]KAG3288585.1 tripartite motif containing 38 [Ictidomys tridecemlineatus]